VRVVYDIEANGFTPDVIWCVVCYDLDTQEYHVFTEADKFVLFAANVDTWIGHNVISYDNYWIEKLWGYHIPVSKVVDTMVLSRMFNRYWVDRGTKKTTSTRKKHSLAYWGEQLGFPKGDFTDFSMYSEEMLQYCIQDVKVTTKVYQCLMKENR